MSGMKNTLIFIIFVLSIYLPLVRASIVSKIFVTTCSHIKVADGSVNSRECGQNTFRANYYTQNFYNCFEKLNLGFHSLVLNKTENGRSDRVEICQKGDLKIIINYYKGDKTDESFIEINNGLKDFVHAGMGESEKFVDHVAFFGHNPIISDSEYMKKRHKKLLDDINISPRSMNSFPLSISAFACGSNKIFQKSSLNDYTGDSTRIMTKYPSTVFPGGKNLIKSYLKVIENKNENKKDIYHYLKNEWNKDHYRDHQFELSVQ